MTDMNFSRLSWKPPILGTALFLFIHYVLGIIRLATSSTGMENKFSALARDKYMAFLIKENLHAGVAYLILCVLATLCIMPLWYMWEKRCKTHGKWAMSRAFLLTLILHGFCVLRLSQTRPYFLSEEEFGRWYFHLCGWFPQWLSWLTFQVIPLAFLIWVAVWHLFRLTKNKKARAAVTCITALLIAIPLAQSHGLFTAKSSTTQASATKKQWNVIMIGSDSLRGDRMGFTGYQANRSDGLAAQGPSPTIDALAAESQLFTHCFTPIASTLESNTALHASLYPHHHGFRHMYPSREQVEKTTSSITPIASILADHGYETAAIGDWCAGFYQVMPMGNQDVSVSTFDSFKIYMSQAVIMAHFVIPLYFDHAAGFKVFHEIDSFAQFVTPDVVTTRVEEKLKLAAEGNKPFFWHVFYSCNHLPYRTAEPYCRMFTDPAYQGRNKNSVDFDIDEFIGGTDLENKWNNLTPADAKQISALYDGCTRQFDDCVKRIVDALKKNGQYDNTIIIISSDHGDDLYEPGATLGHGLSFHGGDQTNHVPMLVYIPGMTKQIFPQTVRTIDVAPTILELLSIERPSTWDGKSFAPWIQKSAAPVSRPFYAETGFPFIQFRVENITRPTLPPMDELTFIDDHYDYHFVLKPEYEDRLIQAKQRCLRTERWKMILTPQADGGRNYRLFHISEDPHCENNVAAAHPEITSAMKQAIDRWVDEKLESDIVTIFPQGEP